MSEMAALISEIKPSVTATTTTSASLNAPAASVKVVLQEHPNASPKGWADWAVRLTTCKMSWPARCQAGANSRDTSRAHHDDAKVSHGDGGRFALTDSEPHRQERPQGHQDAAEPQPIDLGNRTACITTKSRRTLSCSHTVISKVSCSGSNDSTRNFNPQPSASYRSGTTVVPRTMYSGSCTSTTGHGAIRGKPPRPSRRPGALVQPARRRGRPASCRR